MDRTEIRVAAHVDLVDRVARFESFRVLDRSYSAELLVPQLTIDTKDLLSESASCAALILYWGIEAARAKRHAEQTEAAYRAWRDRAWIRAKGEPDAAGKFPSADLAEKLYRQSAEYGPWQARKIAAQEGFDCASAVLEAFRAKAQMIKAQEQLLRDEAGGPYHVVEERPTGVPRQPR
jgi:hypothetical protein